MKRNPRKTPKQNRILLPLRPLLFVILIGLPRLFGQSGASVDLYQKGLVLWEAKDFDKAAQFFEQAVKTDPAFANPYLSLGIYYDNRKQDFAKAAASYMTYISLNGEKKNEARQWLKIIAALKYKIPKKEAGPHRAALLAYNAAVKLIQSKNYDAALLKLNDSLAILPYYIDALYARGLVYNEQKSFFQAMRDLEQVWLEDPEYRDISYYLGLLYDIFTAKSPKTLGLYKKYLATPGIPADRRTIVEDLVGQIEKVQSLQQQALAAYQKNDLAAVEKIYLEALEIRPNDIQSLNNLGIINIDNKRPKKAEEFLLKAKNINPYDPSPYYNLACLYAAQNDREKALLYFKAGANYMQPKMKSQALRDDDLLLIREDLKLLIHE